jgi:DNA polymerase III alpha subunit
MDNTDYIQKRSFLMANVENILENISSRRESKKNESDSLFGSSEEDTSSKINFKTEYKNLSKFEALMMEKEALGLYVSGNPLNEFEPLLEFCRNVVDDPTIYFVLIEKIKKVFTKAGAMMLVMNITMPNQSLEGVIFSKKAMQLSSVVAEKKIFIVKGKIQEPKNKKEEGVADEDNGAVEEIKKLIFDTAVPFESGILSLLERAELPLSNTRKEIVEKLDWNELLFYPDKFEEMIKDENIIKKITSKTPKIETIIIKISSKLGIEKAKEIKSKLSKTPQNGYVKAVIKVEHDGNWKTMENDFWIEKGYYETIQNLVK